jgi:hypothetical protein
MCDKQGRRKRKERGKGKKEWREEEEEIKCEGVPALAPLFASLCLSLPLFASLCVFDSLDEGNRLN